MGAVSYFELCHAYILISMMDAWTSLRDSMMSKEQCHYRTRTRKSMAFFLFLSPDLKIFSGCINVLCAVQLGPWDSLS